MKEFESDLQLLTEDYKRRAKTVQIEIRKMEKRVVKNAEKLIRLRTKLNCYKTFAAELSLLYGKHHVQRGFKSEF